jgi:hypothetical protein
LEDLRADFLVFYRIRDWDRELDAPTFFSLAYRTFAYQGVMAARAMAEDRENDSQSQLPPQHSYRSDDEHVDVSNPTVLQAHPAFQGLFEYSKSGG